MRELRAGVVLVDHFDKFYIVKAFNSMENSELVNIIRLDQAKEAKKRHDDIYPLGVSQEAQLLSGGHHSKTEVPPIKRKSPKK